MLGGFLYFKMSIRTNIMSYPANTIILILD